ncbi:MAG: hypothetical protein JSW24_01400 [Dehalococcoidia bacterium]|nr:MAG: hypothetical protein JSW24_01400 [Dehalococcoidia bacterium]
MSEEKSEEAITKTTKKAREKSAQYPSYDLSPCIEFVRVVDKLGRNQVAEGSLLSELRLKSSNTKSYKGKLSSSRQFGLLDSKAGLLSITERANLVLYPTEEKKDVQFKKLIIEAFRSPALYQKLINRFDGKGIPKLETLANILMNEYKIAKAVKNSAAKVFVSSAKFAGVLGDNNVLQVGQTYEAITGEAPPAETEIPETGQKPPPMGQVHSLKLALSSGKSATITVPSDITRADVERLKSMLELLAVEEGTE